jgi:carboxypeptidase Taq
MILGLIFEPDYAQLVASANTREQATILFNEIKKTIEVSPRLQKYFKILSGKITCKLNNNDVRITFSNNKSIFDHVCTVIHEGGHGIFEQSVGEHLSKYPIYDIGKYALHESQSRFFENILGRNINFWIPIYDELKEKLKLNISVDDFVSYLNKPEPSFIRTEADELTYCLHIILRYEIEKDLFSGKITTEELPTIWKQKMQEYLGIEVTNDADGILQDVHWSQGSFGYFPSYLIGSIIDGMLIEAIEQNVGNIDKILKEKRIKEITKYLQDNIHINGGSYTIDEIINQLCKKELTVQPLVNYFKNKYQK